jgi:nitrite reductase (NO-forming)
VVPAHPHLGLGSLTILGIVLGVVAAIVGFGALYGVATQDGDDAHIEALIDDRLGTIGAEFSAVTPDIVPKSQLTVADEVNTAYAPDVPPPSGRTTPAIVDVRFEVVEGVVAIDPATGVEFETWGYKLEGDSDTMTGTPGPIVRARVGDVLTFTLTNPASNNHSHNVDFHAVTGQGGGAADTLVAPGETKTIEARLLYPGIFMYHCAAEDVPAHIAHGMYGGILVDPAEPLPPADHEFYVVQSEFYTVGTEPGLVELDRAALTDEHPTMVVFNGAKGALAGDNALEIAVGDRARFYFVNAGLNLDSNFHPIGSHWDAVWPEGATLNQPLRGSQTTLVPAGGGVVVDLVGVVPSNIILVDHALTRTFDKGALGIVKVVGDANPEIFEAAGGPPAAAEPLPEGDFTVDIPEGAFTPQDLGDPSEFGDAETPADYSVNVLTIPVGSTVVWVNSDSAVHTVTDVDGAFDSGNINPGRGFAYTFDQPGEYEYFCIPHPWMRAKVIVEG